MIIELLYFILPAALANMMPVFVKKKMRYLDYPLDFDLKISGKIMFGRNKTFRGLVSAIAAAILTVYIQVILYDFNFFREISLIDYSQTGFLVFGFLTGFSVILGDAFGSFIKRRLNIKPGNSLLFVDQLDAIVGFGLIVIPIYLKDFKIFLSLALIWLIGHFVLKFLGYTLKIDKKAI